MQQVQWSCGPFTSISRQARNGGGARGRAAAPLVATAVGSPARLLHDCTAGLLKLEFNLGGVGGWPIRDWPPATFSSPVQNPYCVRLMLF